MRPRVTVVVANYNGDLFIREALRSALSQTIRDIEVIVVDNCSTDGSRETIAELARGDPRLRLYRTERNSGGPSTPRNIGIARARGEWIAIMDSDDLMRSDRLATLLDHAEQDGADIVADDLSIFNDTIDKSMRLLPEGAAFWIDAPGFIRANTFYGHELPLGLLKPVINARLLADMRYHADLHIAEDCDLLFRLLLKGARMKVYPEPMYYYRKHDNSISHRLSVVKLLPALRYSLKLIDENEGRADVLDALRFRHQGILRAIAFSDLVEAIKDNNVPRSIGIGMRHPGALRLLGLPLVARLRRIGVKLGFADTPIALK